MATMGKSEKEKRGTSRMNRLRLELEYLKRSTAIYENYLFLYLRGEHLVASLEFAELANEESH
jgi:hypothetical protein